MEAEIEALDAKLDPLIARRDELTAVLKAALRAGKLEAGAMREAEAILSTDGERWGI